MKLSGNWVSSNQPVDVAAYQSVQVAHATQLKMYSMIHHHRRHCSNKHPKVQSNSRMSSCDTSRNVHTAGKLSITALQLICMDWLCHASLHVNESERTQ